MEAIRSFIREFSEKSLYDFQERRSYLKIFLILSIVFFAFYYLAFLIPVFGVDSDIFVYEFIAGSFIPIGFVFANYLGKRIEMNIILFIPSLCFSFASLYMLSEQKYYKINHMTWSYAQIIGMLIISYVGTLRYASFLYLFNLISTFSFVAFYNHLSIVNILQQLSGNQLVSIFAIYFSYKNAKIKRERMIEQSQAKVIKDSSGLGLWQWNLNTNHVEFDERCLGMLGYKKGELENSLATWEQLINPNDLDSTRDAFSKYLSGKSKIYEVLFSMKHKFGHWVTILSKGKITKRDEEGKVILFSGTHFDYSNFDQIIRANRNITEAINNTLIYSESDIHGNISIANKKLCEISGYDFSELIGKNYKIFNSNYHDTDFFADLWRTIKSGKVWQGEIKNRSKNGDYYWVLTTICAQYDNNKEICGYIALSFDISKQKKYLEELELEKLKFLQTSKLASLGEMSAGLIHEINNPLAIISTSVSVLDKIYGDSEKSKKIVSRVTEATKRISSITESLRRFSRNETKSKGQSYQVLDILEECHKLSTVKSKTQNVPVKINQTDNFNIFCDNIQIEQILINLVNNAIDAVSKQENPWVEISADHAENMAYIYIKDSGSGIDSSSLDKIFNPFFTTKEIGKGTGLGLSLSKGLAESNGGELSYKLVDGHTCFILRIPKEAI